MPNNSYSFYVVWIDDVGKRREADNPYRFNSKFDAMARAYALYRRDEQRFDYQVVVPEGGISTVLLNLSKYALPSSAKK